MLKPETAPIGRAAWTPTREPAAATFSLLARAARPTLAVLLALAALPGLGSFTGGAAAPGPSHLVAQERRDTAAADTAAADTLLTARDSAALRVRRRLEALARPPGLAPDTLPPGGAVISTPTSRRGGGGLAPGDELANQLMALPGYRITRYSAVAATYDAGEERLVLYGSEGAPDIVPAPDTLTTEQADSVLAVADSLGERIDSLGVLAADTTRTQEGRQELVATMDSLRTVADSLRVLAAPGEGERQVVRAILSSSEGYQLEAEQVIRFDQRREVATARGDPTFTPADGGEPVEADSLNIDVAAERASAFAAKTTYAQGGGTNWNVRGDLPYVGQRLVYGHRTRFTSCDLEVPHYHFETDNLKIVQGRILVARPVRLYFADVPVAWLPFVAQSLAQGRASGLLTPRFSVNDIVRTSGGYRRRISNVGFYWAMSDYTDATVAGDWFDDNYMALTGSLRFRWLRQFLDGSVNFRQYWRDSGSTERSLDSQTRWQPSERTSFTSSIRYVTSADFVRRNSFDPREVTQQITSSGGLSHRFDWGTLNVSGNRTQSLSDDVVNMTLPDVSLSLNSMTLFQAPEARAAWYNNVTWGGSAQYSRSIVDRPTDTLGFSFAAADQLATSVSANSSLSVGALSFSQGLSYREGTTREVPLDSLIFFPDQAATMGMRAFDTRAGRALLTGQNVLMGQEGTEGRRVDVAEGSLNWNLGLDWQQNLIGSTTFTPRLNLSGEALRSDTMEVAQSFVSAPTRISFGANLKADVYGFYPGFGEFEAVRHKLTPSFSYDWAPEVEPSQLQEDVFGARAIRPRSVMSVTLNQTWEAKRRSEETDTSAAAADSLPDEGAQAADEEPAGVDDTSPDIATSDAGTAGDETGPRRLEQGQIINLLSIRTSMVRYDFEADTLGFLSGFDTPTLQNQISSDFLRGLTVSMTHDLFDDGEGTVPGEGEGDGQPPARTFDPHLQALNFGFSLNARSQIFRLLGLGGTSPVDDGSDTDEEDLTTDEPYAQRSATDETSILPGRGTDQDVREERGAGPARRDGADWNASFSYSLNRPRLEDATTSQMLTIGLNLNPSAQWEMSWNTAYDLEASAFNDHRIRLTRDLHRWQAHFDFLKTATGNWTFRFEVSLLDNQDLHFDYEQRNLETLSGDRRR